MENIPKLNLPLDLPGTLTIGANSYIGRKFFEEYPRAIGTARFLTGPKIYPLELMNPDNLGQSLDNIPLEGISNALILAAVSKIQACEYDPLARKINVDGTTKLLEELVLRNIKPVFFSSDSVFDGKTGYYDDDAPANPIIEYGRHKAEIERRIAEITSNNYLVVRLSKIFSLEKGDGSFFDEMAQKFVREEKVKAAYDNFLCPTLRDDVVQAVACLQSMDAQGVVHVCSPEKWTRYGLALELAKEMNIDGELVKPVSIDDFGGLRPKFIAMNTRRMKEETDFEFTSMKFCIEKVAN